MYSRLGVLGCGTMGRAVLKGVLSSPPHAGLTVVASVRSAASEVVVREHLPSVTVGRDNIAVAEACDVILLAVKPQVAGDVLSEPGLASALRGKLLVSLCAGVTLTQLRQWLPGVRIVRAMPNTPALVGEGMTVLSPASDVSDADLAWLQELFAGTGRVLRLEEHHLDAVTGLSGSGPAFVCVILDALAAGGVMMGLPRAVAVELAAQTMKGTASMVLETGDHPAALRDRVTTPAGCTIAGLFEMEAGNVRSTLARTIREAASVASGLGTDKN